MVSEPVFTALVAGSVTVILGTLVSVWRYVFGVQLATKTEVEQKIAQSQQIPAENNEIIAALDEHGNQLDEIEDLILGGEYQVDDGMLEVVRKNVDDIDEHGDRIDSIERIQLKIRRREDDNLGEENGD